VSADCEIYRGKKGIDYDEEGLPVFLPHLFKDISDIERTDLLVILKLEELVAPMPRHVHEDITPLVRQ
jgi:hypothetical protein